MEKWTHKSLQWIHNVREQNYEATSADNARQIADGTLKSVQHLLNRLNIKIVSPASSPK